VRIRENQRRSRNRRKELIEELQKRVYNYEQQGVVATQDMQRAARRVAKENAGLRSLLARHGVMQDEVESYLQSFNEEGASKNGAFASIPLQSETVVNYPSAALGAVQVPKPAEPISHEISNTISKSSNLPAHDRKNTGTHAPRKPGVTEPLLINQDQTSTPTPRHGMTYSDTRNGQSTDDSDCPNTADCFCPPTTKPPIQPLDSGLEISCERAAAIITAMRGDTDLEAIRASLGCAGRKECTVRNSTVLQIMDEG
jgi:hypothetical protein